MEAEKKWTKEEIREKLQENDVWVKRAIVAIWNYQTDYERACGDTKDHNNVGFNGVDASFLSSLAEQIKKKNWLSEKQLSFGRKKILKYSGQLAKIANGEI